MFLLRRLARSWGRPVPEAYAILRDTGVMGDYVIPLYDVLHTQGADCLAEDVAGLARERGAEAGFGEEMPRALDETLKERLEADIVARLSDRLGLGAQQAMDAYYASDLARQIDAGECGMQNMDAGYLVDDLLENEPGLFA